MQLITHIKNWIICQADAQYQYLPVAARVAYLSAPAVDYLYDAVDYLWSALAYSNKAAKYLYVVIFFLFINGFLILLRFIWEYVV